jgi:Icc-related predicted phosphoesterase
MKIQIASDLHLEFSADFRAHGVRSAHAMRPPGLAPSPDADVLVIAGDIHAGTAAFETFRDWPVPVLYVAGNHEAYGLGWTQTIDACRAASDGRVRFLERDGVVIDGVRFLGATLWTDYELFASRHPRDAAMEIVGDALADYRRIGDFIPTTALEEHRTARAWLAQELARSFAGPTVVITHHGVHPQSVHRRYGDDPVSAGFVSDLSDLLPKADLWIHGHVHDSFDYRVAGTRVVVNPRGYPFPKDPGRFENTAFDPLLVVEVGGLSSP